VQHFSILGADQGKRLAVWITTGGKDLLLEVLCDPLDILHQALGRGKDVPVDAL
jgi:hypothetical protein